MSGYPQQVRTIAGRVPSSAVNHPDGSDGPPTVPVIRPYVAGNGVPPAKRVLVPTHSRTIAGSYGAPTYRTYNPSARCNAVNRLETVADDKDQVVQRKNTGNAVAPYSADASGSRVYRNNDKSRGLRHFSTKVCEKVKEKGRTNYNEVADELVAEYFDSLSTPPQSVEKQQYDMKNIRRRVYDALNVLMAMNIIEKEKKEIRWVGLPTSSHQECRRYEEEKIQRQESIRKKTEQLKELIIQLVAYKTLVQRNRENERQEGRPQDSKIIYLPFIVINTSRETVVDCAIASDKTEFLFHFDRPFEIHDDIEILKRLGLSYGLGNDDAEITPEVREHIRNCLPPALREYADQIIDGTLIAPPPTPSPPKAAVVPVPTASGERKIPIIRAGPGSAPIRTIIPTSRAARSVIRPRNVQHHYRPQVMRTAGQPYTIPPSSVYRSGVHYTLPNGRVVAGQQRYVQRNAPRLQTSYTANEMADPNIHYEDEVAYEEEYQYEQ